MSVSRRTFLRSTAVAAAIAPTRRLVGPDDTVYSHQSDQTSRRFDPWVEVIPANLTHNATTLRRLGGSPILAVIKNHGYGLDYRVAARVLEAHPDIAGFALVRVDEAITLREQGVRKPILLMARVDESMLPELAARRITLAVYADDEPARIGKLRAGKEPLAVHAYIDTGMSRMGIAYHRAMPFLRAIAALRQCRLTGGGIL